MRPGEEYVMMRADWKTKQKSKQKDIVVKIHYILKCIIKSLCF